jgi:hypothetical protein
MDFLGGISNLAFAPENPFSEGPNYSSDESTNRLVSNPRKINLKKEEKS